MRPCIIFLCAAIYCSSSSFAQKHTPNKKRSIQHTMVTDKITNTIANAAIDALQKGDINAWAALFAADAIMTDDGNPMSLKKFSAAALGHERFTSIDKVENNGKDIYGHFHSDQWGDFKTFF